MFLDSEMLVSILYSIPVGFYHSSCGVVTNFRACRECLEKIVMNGIWLHNALPCNLHHGAISMMEFWHSQLYVHYMMPCSIF